MKGSHALPLLLALGIAAGTFFYYVRRSKSPPPASEALSGETNLAIDPARFAEAMTGLQFEETPAIQTADGEELIDRIKANLKARFGPDGLAHRGRAFGLLGLLPPGQDLEAQLVAMHAAGTRAWFDDLTGEVVALADLDLSRPDDRGSSVRLRVRQLLHQHDPPPAEHPGDDPWLIREAIHAGIASSIESRFLAETGGRGTLPTAEETEREATLLTLPLFLHNLAQVGILQGRDFVESKLADNGQPWAELLSTRPTCSLPLFGPQAAPATPPALPETADALFEGTLGAYFTYLLFERLSDYLQAEELSPAWRSDRYRLFSNPGGDQLIWICRWETADAAGKAARLIEATLSPAPDDPSFGTEPRHTKVTVDGATLIFLNCADRQTLQSTLSSITNNQ